jgi:hypothetical protein
VDKCCALGLSVILCLRLYVTNVFFCVYNIPSFVLFAAVLIVSYSDFVFIAKDKLCVLLISLQFLQCSEYLIVNINICVIHVNYFH